MLSCSVSLPNRHLIAQQLQLSAQTCSKPRPLERGTLCNSMDADNADEEIRSRRSLAIIETDDEEASSLYVLTEFENSTFTITVSNGSKTWAGKVSSREVKAMAGRVEMPEDSYLDEMLKALTRENVGNLNFAYSARAAPGGCLELTFKRHLVADDIRFQLGTVKMQPQPPERAHALILRYSVDAIASLKEQGAESNREKARLVSERQVALDQLEKCVHLKEAIETELFGKFKEVLNTKKSKIRALSKELKDSERSHATSEPAAAEVVTSNRGDHSTGEEDEDAQTPSPKAKPSSSVAMVPSSGSGPTPSSLLDDAVDHEPTSSPPMKRRRRTEQQRRPPPGKQPSIPKPPPTSMRAMERGGGGGKADMTKPTTSASDKHPAEQTLGSDELLDLL